MTTLGPLMNFLTPGQDQPTDLSELAQLLTEHGIEHQLRPHPASAIAAKSLIGFNPAGDWQIIIKRPEGDYSVIRGYASFGTYEIMGTSKDAKFQDPIRFDNPAELVAELEEL